MSDEEKNSEENARRDRRPGRRRSGGDGDRGAPGRGAAGAGGRFRGGFCRGAAGARGRWRGGFTEEPEAEPAPEEAAGEEPPAADDDEAEAPTPKQLRKAARARASGPAKPQRSVEERATERSQRRSARSQARRRYRAAKRGPREPGQGTPPVERRPAARKVRQGVVVSDKANKTITVRFEVARRHPVYEKVVRRTATLHAHDEANEANEGDIVRVVESRPVSRTKRWRLAEILERAR